MTGGKDEAWIREQREDVEAYLREEGLSHRRIGDWPAWHVAPLISIWAVESLKAPGSVGWWVICGDGPTDYCSAAGLRHPRLALRHFASEWRRYVADTPPGAPNLDSTDLPAELAFSLLEKAERLALMADDETLWPTETYG